MSLRLKMIFMKDSSVIELFSGFQALFAGVGGLISGRHHCDFLGIDMFFWFLFSVMLSLVQVHFALKLHDLKARCYINQINAVLTIFMVMAFAKCEGIFTSEVGACIVLAISMIYSSIITKYEYQDAGIKELFNQTKTSKKR